jgi:cytochrome c peroxidase
VIRLTQMRSCLTISTAMILALTSACDRADKSVAQRADGQDTSQHAPTPILEAGPLARPRQLNQFDVPVVATRAAVPRDNPQMPEAIALGKRLFFDGRLSADGTVPCSTCHNPAQAFTDGLIASIGIQGRVGQRNSPTILNALYNNTQF